MRISNGKEELELERKAEGLQIRLTATQFSPSALTELPAPARAEKEGDDWLIFYPVSKESQSLSALIQGARSRLERLSLAQKLTMISKIEDEMDLPFLHPENILLEGSWFQVIHHGLKGEMTPMAMTEGAFLDSYKALILNIFNPKSPFESLIYGELPTSDEWLLQLSSCESTSEINRFIDQEAARETRKVNQREMRVSRLRYRFFQWIVPVALLLCLAAGWFAYSFRHDAEKQRTIVTAQTSFLTDNYAQAQADLEGFALTDLPKSARYVLAVSSVNLSDLTLNQKESILNNLSPKTDDNTLNYWSDTGRGDFDKALDLAKNLGDTQLTLLAYTNLYESAKLDTTMNGEKKQKLMTEYEKQIDELTKTLAEE
ncbi:type VII secretion protein EssB [Lactovum odontotermitis]